MAFFIGIELENIAILLKKKVRTLLLTNKKEKFLILQLVSITKIEIFFAYLIYCLKKNKKSYNGDIIFNNKANCLFL